MSNQIEEKELYPLAVNFILKPIEDTTGYYVSNTGHVFRRDKDRNLQEMKRCLSKVTGYIISSIKIDSIGCTRPKLVHRLVAQAFIPNPENKREVNHIDCNKQNNDVTNLEWVTPKENTAHAIANGLYDNQLRAVNQYDLNGNYIDTYKSISSAAAAVGHPNKAGNIVACCTGAARSVWGYMWFYADIDDFDHVYVDYDEERRKPVDQFTMDGKFICRHESATAAARAIGKSQANIYYCCEHQHHHNSAYGYRWEYSNK